MPFANNMRRYYKAILEKIEAGDTSYRCLCANCNCMTRREDRVRLPGPPP